MKPFILAAIAALAIAGPARAQEPPKSHEHENIQPPAVAEQKAEAKAEPMCMCCMMDKKDMHAAMQDKMKEMMKNEKK